MGLRMLRDIPTVGWVVVALAVVRAAATSAGILEIARVADAALAAEPVGAPGARALAWFALAAILMGIETYAPAAAQPREEARWRDAVVREQLSADIDDPTPAGEQVARATDEVERFAHYRTAFLGPLAAAFIVPLVVAAVIAWQVHAGVAAAVAVGVAVVPVVIGWFMARFRASSGRYRMLAGRLSALFLETMRARPTIRHLGAESQRRGALVARAQATRAEVMRLLRRNQVVILVTDAVFGVALLAVLGALAVAGADSGWLSAGTAIALLLLSGLLREPIDRLGRSFYVGLAGRAAGDRIRPTSSVAPSRAAESVVWTDGSLPDGAWAATSLLSLRGARVRRGGSWPVSGIDLDIPVRGLIALMGRSGAGKSSIGLAIAGLVDADGIRLGAQEATPADLRASVAYLPQRPVLFTGSVRENLRLAAPEASDEAMAAALARAGLGDAGSELPAGLDTRVGEGASGVSGGQAQRICIARALLTGRGVLVADEPTAQLDPASSHVVVDALARLARTSAVVMITHRPDEARRADRVLMLDDDGVVREGER